MQPNTSPVSSFQWMEATPSVFKFYRFFIKPVNDIERK
jgi:hypothetical protein